MNLDELYRQRYEKYLCPAAKILETHIKGCLNGSLRIDRTCARAKDIDRFLQKAQNTEEDGKPKYTNPFNQIQDQLGARVVTYYLTDVDTVADLILRYLRPIEKRLIVPDGDNEFGYFGRHYILLLPTDVSSELGSDSDLPDFFELQIKTLFQHAWAEAVHDLGYKPSSSLSSHQKRKIAFTAAQAWGADEIFRDLFQEVHPGPEDKL